MTTVYTTPELEDKILPLARGSYQLSLLSGAARWSGSDLRGRAKHWGGGYYRSRESLLDRIKMVAPVYWRKGVHGEKVLVIGSEVML